MPPETSEILAPTKTWSPTKITPPLVVDAAPNPRLFERLETGLARPITWLHGPPGAGKTTLVARYLADQGIDPVWYRLDAADSDPATLFFYAGLAAARLDPDAASRLPAVRPEYLRTPGMFSRRFFRALFEVSRKTVVVFDDYHEIAADSVVHGCLAEGSNEIPHNAHVIVISRAPPPKDFARLRMHGAIDLIAPDLLRLTAAEATLVARGRALTIPSDAIERLVTRTAGWTAGLILMMEAAQSGDTRDDAGAEALPELLFDYFAGEVLHRMETRSRRLLMILAFLPTMTSTAAVDLTEDPDAVALLEDLARRNYFTSRDEAAQANYRFHPLFRAFLTTQARAFFEEAECIRLRRRAARALEISGQIEAALDLYQDAGALEDLCRIIRAWAGPLAEKGRHATLRGWLDRLPRERIEADGWLGYWAAATCLVVSPALSRALFQQAFARFDDADDATGLLLAWTGLANSIIEDPASNQADLDDDIALLRDLMRRVRAFPSPSIEFRVAVTMFLALNRRSADRAEIAVWRDLAMASAVIVGDPALVILIRHKIALYALFDCDFATMREQIEAVPSIETLGEEPLLQAVTYLTVGLGQLFGQLPGRCDETAEQALVASKGSGVYLWTHFQAGLEAIAEGDLVRSRKWLRRTAQLTNKVSVYHSAHYQMMAAGIALLSDDVDGAIRSGRLAVEMTIADGWFLYEAMARVGLAEALERAGDHDSADAELAAAEQAASRVALLSLKFSTDCLRADFLIQRGRDAEGVAALEVALEWGERTGSRRTALTPSRNSRLCARALVEGIRPDYARVLIKMSGLIAPDRWIEQWPWPLKITTFGGLRISRQGEPLVLSRKTPRRLFMLLKAIIAFGGVNVPETRLVDAIWPDEDGDAGHNALGIAIHRLRKLIGDSQFLRVKEGRVSLDPARCWLDLWVFESGLGAKTGGPGLIEALGLYKGAFLAGDDDLDFIEPRRAQLAARFKRATEDQDRTP